MSIRRFVVPAFIVVDIDENESPEEVATLADIVSTIANDFLDDRGAFLLDEVVPTMETTPEGDYPYSVLDVQREHYNNARGFQLLRK